MKAFLTKKIIIYFEHIDSEKLLFIFGVQTLNITFYVFEGSEVYWCKTIVQSSMMVIK